MLPCLLYSTLLPGTAILANTAKMLLPALQHLPQNRDVCMITAGDGRISLYKYKYPDQRKVKDSKGVEMGVAGTMHLKAERELSTQPVVAFDWSPDKEGLFCTGSFDQCVRVGFVTKLNTV